MADVIGNSPTQLKKVNSVFIQATHWVGSPPIQCGMTATVLVSDALTQHAKECFPLTLTDCLRSTGQGL